MRWLGCLLGLALLFAAGAPKRADHEGVRSQDEIFAFNDGARPIQSLRLDIEALVEADVVSAPPRTCVEIVHAAPSPHAAVTTPAFAARGPPMG